MKKYIQKIVIAIAIVAFANTQIHAQVTGSYLPTVQQSRTQWCWAASSEMIYWAYKPGTISQCTVVNKSKELETSWWGIGGCNNLNHSSTSACASPLTFNQPQALYGCNGSIQSVLNAYSISSTPYGTSLSAATLASNLAARKLMVVGWFWNGGGGHAVVINRYKNGNVYFNNPGNNSANIWSYNTFKTANGQGNWGQTLRMDNASVYGSTYYRPSETSTIAKVVTEELSINMYPNPATEKVNILMNGEKNTDSKVVVTDAVGKVIFSQQYNKETSSVSLDVASWSRGIYFVTVNNNSKLTKTLSLR